ncbi:MAG: polyprenyl synthetase family protein, partial [Planctomycetota bacterium]|nr:polyprenyl synthetase family protein [Planctomycetota bacterium]
TSKDQYAGGMADVPPEVRCRLTHSTAEELVEYIHTHKTAALIRCSVRVGVLAARATPGALLRLGMFGGELGIAFQIVDDILDTESTTEELGKTTGKDARDMKLTYPLVHGLESSRKIAALHIRRAERILCRFKPGASASGRRRTAFEALHELCGFMLTRRR